MNFTKLGSIAAAGVLLLATATPAFADINITNGLNGAKSHQDISVTSSSSNSISQGNWVSNTNVISSSNSTGHNKANENVGGLNSVMTGDATSMTTVENTSGANTVTGVMPSSSNDVNITNESNGAHSSQDFDVSSSMSNSLEQLNSCSNENVVSSTNSTGHNKTNENVGGSNGIDSGASSSTTNVTNNCGLNQVGVGGL